MNRAMMDETLADAIKSRFLLSVLLGDLAFDAAGCRVEPSDEMTDEGVAIFNVIRDGELLHQFTLSVDLDLV